MSSPFRLRERLLEVLDRSRDQRLAVVGDLIADEFLYGQIARVSREAPVLVLQYRDLVRLPGGAANAANNLLDLGCRVRVVGAVGRDEAGQSLIQMLSSKGADVRGIRNINGYATPIKTRILAGAHHTAPQQVVRIDRMSEFAASFHFPLRSFHAATSGINGIIISDYGYGAMTLELFSKLRDFAKKHGIPVVVDSRFRMSEFRGATSITPNITELEASTGNAIGSDAPLLHKVGQAVLHAQELTCLLVTQGRFGMTLIQRRKAPIHIPIFGTDEVADVTGAGDTVISVFTLALACGGTPEEAARLANYAGGIVVMKRGTATVTPEELRAAIIKDLPSHAAH